ncbi:MAG: prolyl oligopeptidase family serine peptidase [Marinilabiliaceae bacterium]|jgi:dipeptidyl aminopeptidase/acylaminoacyl peptidase|nr:prolyl oligopeptidase family serine peptidase [Marinilabiliaceae bacterium]
MKLMIKSALGLLLCFTILSGIRAQEEKKVLTIDDYPEWNSIVSTSISDNGEWISFGYRPNEGDDTLFFRNVESGTLISDPCSDRPSFSSDSKWVVYRRNLKKKEAEKLRKSKKTVYSKGVLLELATGKKVVWDKVNSISVAPQSDYVVVKKEGAGNGSRGTDMLLKDLARGTVMNIGNVSQYKFNKQGTHLAYLVDAEDKDGNGVYLITLSSGKILALDTDTLSYSQLAWDDEMLYRSEWGSKGTALAVLKGNKPDTCGQSINSLLVFTSLDTDKPQGKVYSPAADSAFPEDYVLSDLGELAFTLDNRSIIISIKEQEAVNKISRDTVPNVDVWHWNDEIIQSVQMVRASRDRRATYKGLLHLDEMSFVQLSSDDMRYVSYNRSADIIIGSDPRPYISDTNWGGGQSDYYLIDAKTGKRSLIEKKIGASMGMSPDGLYFLYFKEGHFFAYNTARRSLTNISESVDVSFTDITEDHPYENRSYGLAGWSDDRKTVFLNHLYDIWAISLDGSGGYSLTANAGNESEIRFRINRTDAQPYINTGSNVYLSAYGEWTKKSGYFLLKDGKAPKQLLFDDASFGRISKAYNAEKYMFTRQTFVDFPDYYIADASFRKAVKQTNANPQQAHYRWGTSRLIDFENKDGERLQAALVLPAGYEEGKKYPMIVYFYEKVSNNLHRYSMPRYDDRPHFSTYASDGYLVLMPDIKYTEGQPGWNALDCVTSATKKVVELGYADPGRLAMQGHSWGGYQSSFILTQTDMFACVVTGAPVTNLTSMYNILYKNSGTNNHGIFELGQVRMGKGMFDDFQNYVDQSPVHNAPGIKTPFMILHGTVDGAVDWNQGLEFYNAARRLGKNVILLSYPDENHHLENKNNQIDFQKRMKQYFDHYLKGNEAPEWMLKGISYKDKKYNKAK